MKRSPLMIKRENIANLLSTTGTTQTAWIIEDMNRQSQGTTWLKTNGASLRQIGMQRRRNLVTNTSNPAKEEGD